MVGNEVLAVHDAQHLPPLSQEHVDSSTGTLPGTTTSLLIYAAVTSRVLSEKQEVEETEAVRKEENPSQDENMGIEVPPGNGEGELPATLRDCVSPARRELFHAVWQKIPPHMREVEEASPEIGDGYPPATSKNRLSLTERETSQVL